jgi:hypothetical protein
VTGRDGLPTTYDELLERLPEMGGTAFDRRRTRRLLAARIALEAAEADVVAAEGDLVAAVRASFAGGDSWRTIGTALGISRQAAQRRYAAHGIGLAALVEPDPDDDP